MHLINHWREAVNLIVLTQTSNTDCDYSVLTVNGTHVNNLHKKTYSMPGGILDATDFSCKWLQLFDRFGVNNVELFKCLSCDGSRPPMITDNQVLQELRRSSIAEEDFVTTDFALRIAAIRHLFVQTGILLVKWMGRQELGSDIFGDWRQKVSQCSVNFIEMCEQLELLPDVCALKEWWNWLTPSSVGSNSRFDTMFYMCFIDKPMFNECQHWSTPKSLIERKSSDDYLLSPAQIYEFLRLLNFKTLEELKQFAYYRQMFGIERWIPVLSLYENGTVSFLPGDDYYPKIVEMVATKPVRLYPQTVEQMRTKSIKFNRIELNGTNSNVIVNIEMPLMQIRPVPLTMDFEPVFAKL